VTRAPIDGEYARQLPSPPGAGSPDIAAGGFARRGNSAMVAQQHGTPLQQVSRRHGDPLTATWRSGARSGSRHVNSIPGGTGGGGRP